MKLFQINESDLETLERELPNLMEFSSLVLGWNDRQDIQEAWHMVKKIVSDVRFNYGPPTQTETITGILTQMKPDKEKRREALMSINRYFEGKTKCPACRGEVIDQETVCGVGPEVFRPVFCRTCGNQWVEIYSLTRLETIEGETIVGNVSFDEQEIEQLKVDVQQLLKLAPADEMRDMILNINDTIEIWVENKRCGK